jgi:hypothetical protein
MRYVEGWRLILEVASTMSSWSSGTRPTLKPSGSRLLSLALEENTEVEIFHAFHRVMYGMASLGLVISSNDWLIASWTQAKRRKGENGQPGASGIEIPLRKKMADVRCEERASRWV